jgi:hypothetical protein
MAVPKKKISKRRINGTFSQKLKLLSSGKRSNFLNGGTLLKLTKFSNQNPF